jgi:TATA-box binding protein (TBP) (component of TFIID and TFIIIB)
MKKSKQIERVATKIQEGLQMWETIGGTPETKLEYEIKQFPKMYHPTEDSITIPLFVDGKKIIVEIKGIKLLN